MSAAPYSCAEHVTSLRQQVSVMRSELKNLRQRVDGAVRAHKKHTASLQVLLKDTTNSNTHHPDQTTAQCLGGTELSLERGHIETVPIGFLTSCFANKNGTPRQPTICTSSRASLQICSAVFNNPEHALTGLEHYSHVWLIFLFHKNGHMSYKAKVKPPRLNGCKVGVYSTRSPHRPNAIGLTLATLEGITGDTLHLSGVDLIDGTPVLDIKPYIPDYDSPFTRPNLHRQNPQAEAPDCSQRAFEIEEEELESTGQSVDSSSEPLPEAIPTDSAGKIGDCGDFSKVLADMRDYLQQGELFGGEPDGKNVKDGVVSSGSECEKESRLCYGPEAYSRIAAWVRDPPVGKLSVRFTPNAEKELQDFASPESTDPTRPKFQFLKGPEEAATAIKGILSADPRSVYRRTRCQDRLFFFSLDTADVTCWFGDSFAEVLCIRPVNISENDAVAVTYRRD